MKTKSVFWEDNCLIILNQTLLPLKVEYIKCQNWRQVAQAIKCLEVRGAPAIGAAAAFGLALGAIELAAKYDNKSEEKEDAQHFKTELLKIADNLGQTRPTAVNLFWALKRMTAVLDKVNSKSANASIIKTLLEALLKEAGNIAAEDESVNERLAAHGAKLFTKPTSVLTHCNAGALATVAVGTALGVIRNAWSQGNIIKVFADETRPLLQGARLTAWELAQDNIPVTLITDNMAGWVMKNKMVEACIVGADRIALNGDTANKIGTYSVAVLAKEHGIPFYVAAPVSTFDFSIKSGDDIPIEEREASEVTHFGSKMVAPQNIGVFNPAFDVTPSSMISAIITEHGILRSPYNESIAALRNSAGNSNMEVF